MNSIQIIHDLAIRNATIENLYKLLIRKYYAKEKNIKDLHPDIKIGDIFEAIEKQIDESKKISNKFFQKIETMNKAGKKTKRKNIL